MIVAGWALPQRQIFKGVTVGAALRGRPFHGEMLVFSQTGGHKGPPLQLLPRRLKYFEVKPCQLI